MTDAGTARARCLECSAELEAGAAYCSECGADARRSPVAARETRPGGRQELSPAHPSAVRGPSPGQESADPGSAARDSPRRPAPATRGAVVVRRIRRVGAALVALGALAAAGWLGWTLEQRRHKPPIVIRHDVKLVTDAPVADGTAPSVGGIDLASARQAFADAGAAPGTINVEQRRYVGEPGVVVAQDPAPAAELAKKVTLTVSQAATMPNVVGIERNSARSEIEKLGATVRAQSTFEPGAKGDAVVRSRPPAGQPIPGDVTLVYAEPESSVTLADLESENSDCAVNDSSTGGSNPVNSIVCSASDTTAGIEYLVARHASRLTTTVGLDDASPPTARALARVRADGHTVATASLRSGHTARIDTSLAGSRRLTLEVRAVGGESADVVWSDATLYGSRRALDLLPTP
jgi:NPCBM/NEW2 domain/PASTA domain